MYDTIRVCISLSDFQHSKILHDLKSDDQWRWVQIQGSTGETRFKRLKGLTELHDQHSFHRDILWDIPDTNRSDEKFLTLEFSLPKFWQGHNIHLLYELTPSLEEMRRIFSRELHLRLPPIRDWLVKRLDLCYAWHCPTQVIAEQVLESLKRLHYPRKKPTIFPSAVMFVGKTYSLKFYLKLPEFINNDRKALIEEKAKMEWINYLEELADGVLRCEATLRSQWLGKNGIKTVHDLIIGTGYVYDSVLRQNYPQIDRHPDLAKNLRYVILNKSGCTVRDRQVVDRLAEIGDRSAEISDKMLKGYLYDINKHYSASEHLAYFDRQLQMFKGGGFVAKDNNPMTILDYFLTKLLGNFKGMETLDQIVLKLGEKYKPVKAARLTSFWLYVQRLGSQKAKDSFGHDSFYASKRDLKSAGVSLLEPIKVINATDRFISRFELDIPSQYVVNKVSDYRDSGNLLNLPKVSS